MNIRVAIIDDLDTVIELNKIVDYGNPDDFMKKSILQERVYVYIDETRIVGFLLFQYIWGNTPFVSLVKVHPDFQYKWVGSKLVWKFESVIINNWYKYYYSSTWEDNTWSQTFHDKLWFQKIWELNMKFGKEIFYKKAL